MARISFSKDVLCDGKRRPRWESDAYDEKSAYVEKRRL